MERRGISVVPVRVAAPVAFSVGVDHDRKLAGLGHRIGGVSEMEKEGVKTGHGGYVCAKSVGLRPGHADVELGQGREDARGGGRLQHGRVGRLPPVGPHGTLGRGKRDRGSGQRRLVERGAPGLSPVDLGGRPPGGRGPDVADERRLGLATAGRFSGPRREIRVVAMVLRGR